MSEQVRQSSVKRLVRLGRYEQLILRALFCQSRSLYDVYQLISNIYRGYSTVYCSNVYTLASQLEDRGLIRRVTTFSVRSRCLFEITEDGMFVLLDYLDLDSRIARLLPNDIQARVG
jgi:DNA-binding PadR family transcriptional regulator